MINFDISELANVLLISAWDALFYRLYRVSSRRNWKLYGNIYSGVQSNQMSAVSDSMYHVTTVLPSWPGVLDTNLMDYLGSQTIALQYVPLESGR